MRPRAPKLPPVDVDSRSSRSARRATVDRWTSEKSPVEKHLVYVYTQGNVWYDMAGSQWSQDSLGVHALLKFILG